jgi:hypothetical protein
MKMFWTHFRYWVIYIVTMPAYPLGFLTKLYFVAFMSGWNQARRFLMAYLNWVLPRGRF